MPRLSGNVGSSSRQLASPALSLFSSLLPSMGVRDGSSLPTYPPTPRLVHTYTTTLADMLRQSRNTEDSSVLYELFLLPNRGAGGCLFGLARFLHVAILLHDGMARDSWPVLEAEFSVFFLSEATRLHDMILRIVSHMRPPQGPPTQRRKKSSNAKGAGIPGCLTRLASQKEE